MNPNNNLSTDSNDQDDRPAYNDVSQIESEVEPATKPSDTDSSTVESENKTASQNEPAAEQPLAVQPPGDDQAVSGPAKSKKPLIVGLIAAVIVLLVGGGVAAYSLWYQNPQKVVTDSIVNALKSKSFIADTTINIKNIDDTSNSIDSLTIEIDSKTTRSNGQFDAKFIAKTKDDKQRSLGASVMFDSQANLYFKVNQVKQLLDEYMGFSNTSSDQLEQLVNKIDNKWIRVASEDYSEVSEQASQTQECLADVFKKFEKDQQAQSQITEAYRNNQFIVIKEQLGNKDGNLGYRIGGDSQKAEAFAKDLKDTTIYKQLKDCDDSFDVDTSDVAPNNDDDTEIGIELWISQFSHELKQAKIDVKDEEVSATFDINTSFNQPVNVKAPKDFIPIKDLIDDVTTIIYGQTAGGSEDAVQLQSDPTISDLEI